MSRTLALAVTLSTVLAQHCDPTQYGFPAGEPAWGPEDDVCVNDDAYIGNLFGNTALTCAAINCDGSGVFGTAADADWGTFFSTICPVKCGTCATFCTDKTTFLQAWSNILTRTGSTASPTSCTADWTTLQPTAGFCDAAYRHGCAGTASPPFCVVASSVSGRKDPHLHLAHGGRADFRGEDGKVFNFLSARNVSFNVRTEAAEFRWATRTIHGTRISEASWVLRTSSGTFLTVGYKAPKSGTVDAPHVVTVRNKGTDWNGKVDVAVARGGPPFALEGVSVTLDNYNTLTVVHAGWSMTATVSPFPFGKLNPGKALLDVAAAPLYDVENDPVAPHGLLGQSFDGDDLAVNGQMDSRSEAESTTRAQAEGAIEGKWYEYVMPGPYATAFKYSRFDALVAAPRDVKKLKGWKHLRVGGRNATRAAASGIRYDVEEEVAEQEGTKPPAARRKLAFKGALVKGTATKFTFTQ